MYQYEKHFILMLSCIVIFSFMTTRLNKYYYCYYYYSATTAAAAAADNFGLNFDDKALGGGQVICRSCHTAIL